MHAADATNPDQRLDPLAAETRDGSRHLALIRTLLRLSPEQRLEGLRRASAFFTAARRV